VRWRRSAITSRLPKPPKAASPTLVLGLTKLNGAVLRVPEEFSNIQDAVTNASDEDTIIIAPGEYALRSAVQINGKSLLIRGQMGPDETSPLR
jgi:hypothetical protein